jgi:rhamnosyltransferase subunit B
MEIGLTKTSARRIVLATIGSRGDLYPLLAIGRSLVGRGHQVMIAAPERNRQLILDAGIEFHPLRPDPALDADNPILESVAPNKRGAGFAVQKLIYPFVEDTYRDLLSAGQGADLMVFPCFIFPGPMAAERLGIPWAVIHAAPGTLYSVYDPPYLPPVPWLYPLQRWSPIVPKLFNPLAVLSIRSWSKPLREFQAREGFAHTKGDLLLGGMRSPWLTLAVFSSCIGDVQPDWPKPAVVAGFPFFDESSESVDDAIERFLDAGEPPLIASMGSVVSENRLGFLKNVIEAAKIIGRRLLLIESREGEHLRSMYSSPSLLIVDYVPYSLVFPRACALILSGSVGPLSHALRAARPMLIIAAEEMSDQPDNALRAVRLGVARWVLMTKGTRDVIATHLEALLSEPGYAINAELWGKQVRSEDGNARACDALEAVAARRGEVRR